MSTHRLFTPRRALTLTALTAALTGTACASAPAAVPPTQPVAELNAPSCPPDTRWDGHGCRASISCPDGAELQDGRCLAKLACPPGSWLQNKRCVAPVRCPDGATRQGERCVAPLSCPEGTVQRGNRCLAPLSCPEGAKLQAGRCLPEAKAARASLRSEAGSSEVDSSATGSSAANGATLDSPAAAKLNNAIASLRENDRARGRRASPRLNEAMKLDVFLVSNHPRTRFEIDGFPSGTRTFLLDGGDHVVTFTRPGWSRCRVVLRDTQLGQSITVKDIIAERHPNGCARVTRFDELGRMAD